MKPLDVVLLDLVVLIVVLLFALVKMALFDKQRPDERTLQPIFAICEIAGPLGCIGLVIKLVLHV